MGYDEKGFYEILDFVPKYVGKNGAEVFQRFVEEERRYPVEAFIALKIDLFLTRFAITQKRYMDGYTKYKEIVPLMQKYYQDTRK